MGQALTNYVLRVHIFILCKGACLVNHRANPAQEVTTQQLRIVNKLLNRRTLGTHSAGMATLHGKSEDLQLEGLT